MRGALIEIKTGNIVSLFDVSRPRRIDLPGVGQVSPAEVGWEGEGYKIVAVEEIQSEPEGKQYVGDAIEAFDGEKVVLTRQVEDKPSPPAPEPQPEPEPDNRTVEQKIADAAGITVGELTGWRDGKAAGAR